jgi:threonine dehydrogenase-like Zn-dependent dehydrogenase
MNYELEKKNHISYCGSYCHICDWHTGRIRKTFQSALDMLEDFGFRKILEGKVDAENLKSGLQILATSSICPGCKSEVFRKPEEDRCKIRQWCSGKGFDLCCECVGFPCEILETNPGVIKFRCIENLIKIKEKGVKEWIDGQWKEYVKR